MARINRPESTAGLARCVGSTVDTLARNRTRYGSSHAPHLPCACVRLQVQRLCRELELRLAVGSRSHGGRGLRSGRRAALPPAAHAWMAAPGGASVDALRPAADCGVRAGVLRPLAARQARERPRRAGGAGRGALEGAPRPEAALLGTERGGWGARRARARATRAEPRALAPGALAHSRPPAAAQCVRPVHARDGRALPCAILGWGDEPARAATGLGCGGRRARRAVAHAVGHVPPVGLREHVRCRYSSRS